MTLTTLADRVTALSATCKEWQDRADELGRFATRRDQLREISDRVTEFAAASDVLSQESSIETRLRPVKAAAQTLRVRADDLVQRLASSSQSILKPKALDLFETGLLDEIAKGLHGAWQDFLGTGDRPG